MQTLKLELIAGALRKGNVTKNICCDGHEKVILICKTIVESISFVEVKYSKILV